jgi:hypothetical protein
VPDDLQYTAAEKDLTGKNSTSILRRPGAKEDFVRGRSGQFPFTPGGLDALSDNANDRDRFRITDKTTLGPLISIPPGFSRGLRLADEDGAVDLETTDGDEEMEEGQAVVRSVHLNHVDTPRNQKVQKIGYEGIDDLLPDEVQPAPVILFVLKLIFVVSVLGAKGNSSYFTAEERERMGSCRRRQSRDDKLSRIDT